MNKDALKVISSSCFIIFTCMYFFQVYGGDIDDLEWANHWGGLLLNSFMSLVFGGIFSGLLVSHFSESIKYKTNGYDSLINRLFVVGSVLIFSSILTISFYYITVKPKVSVTNAFYCKSAKQVADITSSLMKGKYLEAEFLLNHNGCSFIKFNNITSRENNFIKLDTKLVNNISIVEIVSTENYKENISENYFTPEKSLEFYLNSESHDPIAPFDRISARDNNLVVRGADIITGNENIFDSLQERDIIIRDSYRDQFIENVYQISTNNVDGFSFWTESIPFLVSKFFKEPSGIIDLQLRIFIKGGSYQIAEKKMIDDVKTKTLPKNSKSITEYLETLLKRKNYTKYNELSTLFERVKASEFFLASDSPYQHAGQAASYFKDRKSLYSGDYPSSSDKDRAMLFSLFERASGALSLCSEVNTKKIGIMREGRANPYGTNGGDWTYYLSSISYNCYSPTRGDTTENWAFAAACDARSNKCSCINAKGVKYASEMIEDLEICANIKL